MYWGLFMEVIDRLSLFEIERDKDGVLIDFREENEAEFTGRNERDGKGEKPDKASKDGVAPWGEDVKGGADDLESTIFQAF